MKTLVISRPIYDYILSLVEYPLDGDNFFIENSIKTTNNTGSLIAIALAKYGMDISYTGMIGEDENGRKIKEILESYNINTKYIETSYTDRTCANYKIYNQKSNKFTTISEKSIKSNLTKYKYEFIPDAIVMDDGDYGANLAAINNYPNSTLIYVGNKFTKDSQIYCNKCNYIITSLAFASSATGVTNNLNKPKSIVQLFQKFIDIYKANLIVRMDNFDILYCVNDEVRLIKNINKNLINKEDVYNAVLIYFLINNNDIENSIKFTNKVMLESSNELDMINNIPDIKVIKEVSKGNLEQVLNKESINLTNQNNVNIDQSNGQNINVQNIIEQQNVINEVNEIELPKIENNIQNTNNGVENVEKL